MESWIHSRLKEKQRSEQLERSEHEGGSGGGLTTRASNSSWGGGEPWEGPRQEEGGSSMHYSSSGFWEGSRVWTKRGSGGPVWCSRHEMRGEKWANGGGTLDQSWRGWPLWDQDRAWIKEKWRTRSEVSGWATGQVVTHLLRLEDWGWTGWGAEGDIKDGKDVWLGEKTECVCSEGESGFAVTIDEMRRCMCGWGVTWKRQRCSLLRDGQRKEENAHGW